MAATATPSKGPKGDKLMRDALMVALKRPSSIEPDKKRFMVIADQAVALAEAGDLDAIKFITERTDGKAVQPVSNDDGPIEHSVTLRWGG